MPVIYIKKYYSSCNYSLYKWKRRVIRVYDACVRGDNGWTVIYFLFIIGLYWIYLCLV